MSVTHLSFGCIIEFIMRWAHTDKTLIVPTFRAIHIASAVRLNQAHADTFLSLSLSLSSSLPLLFASVAIVIIQRHSMGHTRSVRAHAKDVTMIVNLCSTNV